MIVRDYYTSPTCGAVRPATTVGHERRRMDWRERWLCDAGAILHWSKICMDQTVARIVAKHSKGDKL